MTVQRDAVEELFHAFQRGDGGALAADLALEQRMVRVEAALARHVGVKEDLASPVPGFTELGRVLAVSVTQGSWPAQRACAGHDLPQQTPIQGLWHVGDGVKPAGWGGASACAESARLAVLGLLGRG